VLLAAADPPAFLLQFALQFNRLGWEIISVGAAYGCIALCGVLVSKKIMAVMPKWLFVKLEYGLMSYASVKLLNAGLDRPLDHANAYGLI